MARRFTINTDTAKGGKCGIYVAHVKPGPGQGIHVFALRRASRFQDLSMQFPVPYMDYYDRRDRL